VVKKNDVPMELGQFALKLVINGVIILALPLGHVNPAGGERL